jgi:hypothetical protein
MPKPKARFNGAIKVRLSQASLDTLVLAAERRGIRVSEYVRRSVDQALERDRLGHLPISPRASVALLTLETKVPEGTDLLEYLLDNQDP